MILLGAYGALDKSDLPVPAPSAANNVTCPHANTKTTMCVRNIMTPVNCVLLFGASLELGILLGFGIWSLNFSFGAWGLFLRKRPHALRQQFVTFSIKVQLIWQKQLRPRLPVTSQRQRIRVDILQPPILLHEFLYHCIDRFLLIRLLPSRNAWAQRNKHNLRLGQFPMHLCNEFLEITEYFLRRF